MERHVARLAARNVTRNKWRSALSALALVIGVAQMIFGQSLISGVLRGIISSAQSLPDESRRTIEAAFGCRVFDKYGSREFSGIAYECDAHQGHHTVAEGYIVDVTNREAVDAMVAKVRETP